MPANFTESTGRVHPLCRHEEWMGIGGHLGSLNCVGPKSPENFLNLLFPETFAAEYGQNAVVPDNTKPRLLPWIIRSESDDFVVIPTQKHARPDRVGMLENLMIELLPLRHFGPPVFLIGFDEARIALFKHGRDRTRFLIMW